MVVAEEDVPREIGCSYSKPPMCGIGGDVDIYARRSMRCRGLVISELGARLAGCELVAVSSMHNCSDARGMGCWYGFVGWCQWWWYMPAEERTSSEWRMAVESGRRDGSDCYSCGRRLRWSFVTGRRSRRRRDGRGKGVAWTRHQLGQVGRQQTAVAPSAGVVALAAQVQLLRSERGFPGWVV
jgi:hypothetical protein